ncbi:MAG: dTDP-4-dehydrorhamnose 3,5-epimerase family protein [Elusimicrobia bacterium]|nr:dTDP-4-dehydrorhamnose 3,5-epimerase family protein [Elusimicrobiota bacterium]
MEKHIKCSKCPIEGVYILDPKIHTDQRGSLMKVFNYDDFSAHGLETGFKESFFSVSAKNVVRGMHFQTPPFAYTKLVYVTHGAILDVLLDLRRSSPTYGKYFSLELTWRNSKIIYLPRGLAHGFLSLEDHSCVVYMQTSTHAPDHDAGVRWDSFGFDWGIKDPVLSPRDAAFPAFDGFASPF